MDVYIHICICIHTHIYLNISSGTVVAYEEKEGQDSMQDVSFVDKTIVRCSCQWALAQSRHEASHALPRAGLYAAWLAWLHTG